MFRSLGKYERLVWFCLLIIPLIVFMIWSCGKDDPVTPNLTCCDTTIYIPLDAPPQLDGGCDSLLDRGTIGMRHYRSGILLTRDTRITLSGLPPGEYVFALRAFNDKCLFSDAVYCTVSVPYKRTWDKIKEEKL